MRPLPRKSPSSKRKKLQMPSSSKNNLTYRNLPRKERDWAKLLNGRELRLLWLLRKGKRPRRWREIARTRLLLSPNNRLSQLLKSKKSERQRPRNF